MKFGVKKYKYTIRMEIDKPKRPDGYVYYRVFVNGIFERHTKTERKIFNSLIKKFKVKEIK